MVERFLVAVPSLEHELQILELALSPLGLADCRGGAGGGHV
jgi:hypothetical protein